MTNPTERTEHLKFAKARALRYIDKGDSQSAFTSFLSDLAKHPDNASRYPSSLMAMGLCAAVSHDRGLELRTWIEGFE